MLSVIILLVVKKAANVKKVMQGIEKACPVLPLWFLIVLHKMVLLQCCQNWPHLLTRQWAIESGNWVDFHNNY